MGLQNFFFWLWPPYESYIASRIIAGNNRQAGENARWHEVETRIRQLVSAEGVDADDIEQVAIRTQEFEAKRKETLENKASTFIAGIGVTTSVVSVIPSLFAAKLIIPFKWAVVSGTAYMFSVLLFLIAAYYAIKARRILGFASPCADTIEDLLSTNHGEVTERIVLIFSQLKWNEDLLVQKANYLSVAEDLFLRGLAVLAFAATISLTAQLYMGQVSPT